MSANPIQLSEPNHNANVPIRPPMDFQTRGLRWNSMLRHLMNHLVTGIAVLSTVLVIVPLVAILAYLIYKGASSLNWAFFTHNPVPVGEQELGKCHGIDQDLSGSPSEKRRSVQKSF